MPEQVTLDPERGIIEIVAHDKVTLGQMKESRKLVADACKSHPFRGLLHDMRAVTQAPTEDELFNFAKKTITSGRFQGIQLAVLTSQESALPHMFMTLTANRLGQSVRVFADRQAALVWLGDGHNQESDP